MGPSPAIGTQAALGITAIPTKTRIFILPTVVTLPTGDFTSIQKFRIRGHNVPGYSGQPKVTVNFKVIMPDSYNVVIKKSLTSKKYAIFAYKSGANIAHIQISPGE